MAGAAVIDAGDVRELAHLARGERAVGNGDTQHVGVQLQVYAIHEAQRLELVLGQLARDAAADLVAELRHALAHELRVELVVAVHGSGGLAAVLPLPGSGERVRVRGSDSFLQCWRLAPPLTPAPLPAAGERGCGAT